MEFNQHQVWFHMMLRPLANRMGTSSDLWLIYFDQNAQELVFHDKKLSQNIKTWSLIWFVVLKYGLAMPSLWPSNRTQMRLDPSLGWGYIMVAWVSNLLSCCGVLYVKHQNGMSLGRALLYIYIHIYIYIYLYIYLYRYIDSFKKSCIKKRWSRPVQAVGKSKHMIYLSRARHMDPYKGS